MGQEPQKDSRLSLRKYIGTSYFQILFAVIFILILPFLALFIKAYADIVEMRKGGNPEYAWPEYHDLWTAVYACCILLFLNYVSKKLLYYPSERLLKPRYKGVERESRRTRMLDSTLKVTYFTFSVCFGYYVMRNSIFLPRSLGGSGAITEMFRGFPYQNFDDCPYIKVYLMIQLGYHLHSLILHLWHEPRNDFMEMFLHHVMTVALIGLAYFMNYFTTSILVLFTHDFPDAFGHLVKLLSDTPYDRATLAVYICVLITWGYMRLLVFPIQIIPYCTYWNSHYDEIYGMGILGGMLHILLVLHIYWYVLILNMGFKFLRTNKIEDTQHKLD